MVTKYFRKRERVSPQHRISNTPNPSLTVRIILDAAGATQAVLADPARELLFRASRGVPRVASNLLRRALREAHERNQTFIDDHTMELAIDASPSAHTVTR